VKDCADLRVRDVRADVDCTAAEQDEHDRPLRRCGNFCNELVLRTGQMPAMPLVREECTAVPLVRSWLCTAERLLTRLSLKMRERASFPVCGAYYRL
jgi:hypothetical protein